MIIVIEVIVGLVVIFAGQMFWSIGRKSRFLSSKMADDQFLAEFIQGENDHINFSSRVAHVAPDLEYHQLIHIAISSTRAADSRVRLLGLVLAIMGLAASAFMGTIYVAINVVLFFVAAAIPIGEPGAKNALGSIIEIALILYKWHSEAPIECEEFVREAESLQILYGVVKRNT